MNSHFRNAEYNMKTVEQELNSYFPESGGSVENCRISHITGMINRLNEAKESLIKGRHLKFGDENEL